ncbi:MAG: HNH endonuclease [Deltaproteobacteria bacterium]|nr:HNH endonuclease [Deltaproteobacteria bacterium]
MACRVEATARREFGCAAHLLLRHHLYRRLGFVRLADYARERLGVSARTVQAAAWLATRLDALPALSTAFDRSEISWTQARALCAVASAADEDRWLALAHHHRVEELQRLARGARPPSGVPVDPDRDANDIDGEPAVRWRLACPARVRALWRRALELASRMAGEPLADWRAAEIIAAEGSSGRPAGASIGERALLTALRLARRARHSGASVAAADRCTPTDPRMTAHQPVTAAPWPDPQPSGATVRHVPGRSLVALTPADPFALDARLLATMRAIQTSEPRIGRLLRVIVDHRFYRLLGFDSLEAYVRERLGVSIRKAWALLKVEKATQRSEAFARAYHDGTLSWARALALLPVLDRTNAAAWIARAETVTVRRLYDEMNWVLEARDALGARVSLDPPPLDSRLTSRVAVAAGEAECRKMSLTTGAQIRASFACDTNAQIRAVVARDTNVQIGAHVAQSEVCDVEVTFTGPASVVALLRDVLGAFAPPDTQRWQALERLLHHVIAYWDGAPRHRDPIFERDGWRCSVPGCSSRRNLHDHHLHYRSRGGGNEQTNRVAVCAAHHLHGIHPGAIRAWGTAPSDVHWELGIRWNAAPLLTYVGDRLCTRGSTCEQRAHA